MQETTENYQEKKEYNIWLGLDSQNICEFLSDDHLKRIGSQVVRDYAADSADFQAKRDKIQDLYSLALQVVENKSYPWVNASNVKYPLLAKAALSFAALAYPAIVKDRSVVRGAVIGRDDGDEIVKNPEGNPLIGEDGQEVRKNAGLKQKRADRVSKYMSHELLEDMETWEDDTDKILHILPIVGCAFKKTCYDPIEQKNISKLVLPQFLVMSSDATDIRTARRVSEIIEIYPHEIETMIRTGVFRAFDYKLNPATKKTEDYQNAKTDDNQVSIDESSPHVFIEQHLRLDLDDDGYPEPYKVWVHRDTSEVARILPRFDIETIIADGGMDETGGITLGEVKKITPINEYHVFKFFPDPEGSPYGLGFGHYLEAINAAANTSINQLIDAGHRSILDSGFIGTGFKIKKGEMTFKPGTWKAVDSGGMSIRENIVPLQFAGPSPVLFALIEFLIKSAEDMALMTQIMSGQMPANMPATTALASIESGLQPFKAIFRRIHRALKSEFKAIYRLNSKFLTQEKYNTVIDDPEADVEKDFDTKTVDIIPLSDPDFVSDIQAMIKAQFLEAYKDDPFVDAIEIRKRIFKAARIEDLGDVIKTPPKTEDPVAAAQVKAFEAQIEKMNRDNERADIEMALKIESTQAEIIERVARATKAIAEAEGVENGQQLQTYMAQLDIMKERMKSYNDIAGRVAGMAVTPNNQEIQNIPPEF